MKGRTWARAVSVVMFWLLAPAALASTPANLTWTGASTSPYWSSSANWNGAAPRGTVDALTFPALTSGACTASPPASTCYTSIDDLSGRGAISADALAIDDGSPYLMTGDPITLGSGGITAKAPGSPSSGNPVVALPITLAAPQTWSVSGGGPGGAFGALYVEDPVSGPTSPLTVDLAGDGNLGLSADTEVGPLTAAGADTADTGNNAYLNGSIELTGSVNATSAAQVNLNDSELDVFPSASSGTLPTTGALTSTGGAIFDTAELDVHGALKLDSETATTMFIYDQGTTAGTDFSQLSATGDVALGGSLNLSAPAPEAGPCQLNPGQVYPLVTTTGGTVSGAFSNAPDGAVLPLGCGSDSAQINYTAQSVTATVVGTSVSLATDSAAVATNQPVTLTATVTDYPSTSGTVEFDDGGSAISGCGAAPTTPTGSGYTATCQASFAAGASPVGLSATFTPTSGAAAPQATSDEQDLTVTPDATSTTVSTSSAAAAPGSSLTYTATVTPADSGPTSPSGTVTFLDGSSPISGCAGRPLTPGAPSSQATCTVSTPTAGSHAITATYGGDANFSGSAAGATAVAAISATTEPATRITATGAVLNGVVDSGGTAVTWHFEVGRSAAHEQGTPIQTIGPGGGSSQVSWSLKGLSPRVRYHVSLVVGTVTTPQPVLGLGQDRPFTTGPSGQLQLTARNLGVIGDTVAVPERCTSPQRCTGRFTITTRIRTGKRVRSSVCATSLFRLSAHRRKVISSRLTGRCLALLRRAPHHRLAVNFSTRPQSAQLGLNESITLIL